MSFENIVPSFVAERSKGTRRRSRRAQDPGRRRPITLHRGKEQALLSFRRAQTTLGEQLGLDPGPQLRQLERQI
jgi:hypothetical protein